MLYGYKHINNKPRTYCECIGIDNNTYIIRADALQRGATKHLKNVGNKISAINIAGEKYGLLTAIHPTDKKAANGNIIWLCKCDCGNYTEVPMGNLRRNHTLSCGCRHKSKWEMFISNYLDNLHIKYIEQKRFPDCRNLKGSDMLPFDFYLYEINKIIEYDGLHHFEPINGWGGVEKYNITQLNDEIKNKYCRDNNIELLRLQYNLTGEEIKNKINRFIKPVEITA